jgi:spore maturation protein CgeB
MSTPLRLRLFAHSWRSDWNHGNAHFLRGLADELRGLGHEVRCYEPENGWS